MSWIKLDDDTFAKEASPDPQEIVIFSEKEAEKESLETQIANIVMTEYPDGADDDLKEAIDIVNRRKQHELDLLEFELREVVNLLEELWQYK